jgi:antitoxin FitA
VAVWVRAVNAVNADIDANVFRRFAGDRSMATFTIRELDEALERSLRVRAASRNRSMEEEARQILRAALSEPAVPASDLASRVRARFAGMGDVELSLPRREAVR